MSERKVKSSFKEPIGDKDILQRPIVGNRKYQGVKAVVETGYTAEVAEYIHSQTVRLKRQPGELFQRLRTSTVANNLRRQQLPSFLPPMADGGYARPMDEYGGTSAGILAGVDKKYDKVDLLLLDCRSVEEYEKCHILGALHYPRIHLNHSMRPFLPEMYAYKNKIGKYIVVYDFDESIAVEISNILCEKGIDNIGMIAGGLQEFLYDYSSLITGEPPMLIMPRDIALQRRADQITLARSEARSMMSHKPKSLSNSLAKLRIRRL
ncbi:unnamed protein product [Phytomonas sp. EM1]|nr:unnamed protein product [Phytomonas sp. EM1]|eukprot:CCW60698.1 unnamed protein product [Phytomonas sp. isolate EM1]